jgi:hypothetical protein
VYDKLIPIEKIVEHVGGNFLHVPRVVDTRFKIEHRGRRRGADDMQGARAAGDLQPAPARGPEAPHKG